MTRDDAHSTSTVAARIKRYRADKNTSLSQLARDSGISKGYLWRLENPPDREQEPRPSARTLYSIAKALGVTLSDLLGEQLTLKNQPAIDPALREFADQEHLPQADIDMLASIQWRGDPPRSVDRWKFIYHAILTSQSLDEP